MSLARKCSSTCGPFLLGLAQGGDLYADRYPRLIQGGRLNQTREPRARSECADKNGRKTARRYLTGAGFSATILAIALLPASRNWVREPGDVCAKPGSRF